MDASTNHENEVAVGGFPFAIFLVAQGHRILRAERSTASKSGWLFYFRPDCEEDRGPYTLAKMLIEKAQRNAK